MMDIVALLELLLGFTKVTSGISKLSSDSRNRVKAFLIEASDCLVLFAEKQSKSNPTYFECSQLSIYSQRLPKDVALVLGADETRNLLVKLQNLYNSPMIPRIIENSNVNEARVLGLAGELKGIADTL